MATIEKVNILLDLFILFSNTIRWFTIIHVFSRLSLNPSTINNAFEGKKSKIIFGFFPIFSWRSRSHF